MVPFVFQYLIKINLGFLLNFDFCHSWELKAVRYVTGHYFLNISQHSLKLKGLKELHYPKIQNTKMIPC